jgi:glycosyltransferase involved in cell wall biosynthesis
MNLRQAQSIPASRDLVSVIVNTLNSSRHLRACLQSIKDQTYQPIELIVVDNPRTTDATREIAREFTPHVLVKGPERSAQVNHGVSKATGKYVYKVDSDFVLEPTVVAECVAKAEQGADAVVVHNSPDVRVSWIARIRKFEVDMYKYDLTHSSARFMRKDVYEAIGGFNSAITAGEDYDLQNKLSLGGYRTDFIDAEALHLGEPARLWPHLRKMYVYGMNSHNYLRHNRNTVVNQLPFARRIYFRHWRSFLRQPLRAFGFLGYSILKYGAGGLGYAVGLLTFQEPDRS